MRIAALGQTSINDTTRDTISVSSTISLATGQGLSLEGTFPSILTTSRLLHSFSGQGRRKDVLTLSGIFLARLNDIVGSVDHALCDCRSNSDYRVSRNGLLFLANLLDAEIQKQVSDSTVLMAIEIVDMALANLRSFLSLTEKLFKAHLKLFVEPLEDSCDQGVLISFIEEDPGQLRLISERPRSQGHFEKADPSICDLSVAQKTDENLAMAVRMESSVLLAPLAETATNVVFNKNGVVQAATFEGLVGVLTSEHVIIDEEFLPTFFTCFRIFSKPNLFLEELKKLHLKTFFSTREQCPVRIRVGTTILKWLQQYWRPETDNPVLEELRTFTDVQLAKNLPTDLFKCIEDGILQVSSADQLHRSDIDANKLDLIYRQIHDHEKALKPTGFFADFDPARETNNRLSYFDNPSGREEFARQLTFLISQKFMLINPDDVIDYWRQCEHREYQSHTAKERRVASVLDEVTEIERAICSFVTCSILDVKKNVLKERLEFWLDVSARCINLRNFSGAHCILGGLDNSHTTDSTLLVNKKSKKQFQALKQLFSGHKNSSNYRRLLSSVVEPTVPLIGILMRDVQSIFNVVPTSINSIREGGLNMINFGCYRIAYRIVRSMESYLIPYQIQPSATIQIWLNRVLACFPSNHENQLDARLCKLSFEREVENSSCHQVDSWKRVIHNNESRKSLGPPMASVNPRGRPYLGRVKYFPPVARYFTKQ